MVQIPHLLKSFSIDASITLADGSTTQRVINIFTIREFPRTVLEINRRLFPVAVDKIIIEYTIADTASFVSCIYDKYFKEHTLTNVMFDSRTIVDCMDAVEILREFKGH